MDLVPAADVEVNIIIISCSKFSKCLSHPTKKKKTIYFIYYLHNKLNLINSYYLNSYKSWTEGKILLNHHYSLDESVVRRGDSLSLLWCCKWADTHRLRRSNTTKIIIYQGPIHRFFFFTTTIFLYSISFILLTQTLQKKGPKLSRMTWKKALLLVWFHAETLMQFFRASNKWRKLVDKLIKAP